MEHGDKILVDSETAAGMLSISKRHFLAQENSGKIGPMGVKLGARKLFCVSELQAWAAAGCPSREKWQNGRTG